MRKETVSGIARWAAIALLALAAGCHKRPKPHEPAPPPAPPPAAQEPVPPYGAARGLPIPQPGADGSFTTINSGISAQEEVWHIRAALNVAALSCRDDGALTRDYNRFLKDHKPLLGAAYAAETAHFKAAGLPALDRHMTQLYNFFAQPPAQPGFCEAAKAEMPRAVSTSAADYPAYAPQALDRLEAPILAFYAGYDRYRHDLAAWQANPHRTETLRVAARAAPEPAADDRAIGGNWRIQIGAFTGEKAAHAAWDQARARIPSLADYTPHYEPVPGRPGLIRVQLGSATDRAGAIRLCATAAVGGFDCLPVVPKK
ncbi:SPOR domain-containing protein [Flavisphingomonas formosensis]|uniref:SPOR domain-containing protein n=1 Tax=Flavisphingomonas formosensis TaxID=861534 RepID=UPI001E582F28|nr:SPOR domain-containing protein [Sphingomonas formosensis]